jgi:hypothetical protein
MLCWTRCGFGGCDHQIWCLVQPREYAIRMFVPWVVTGETALSTPDRHPDPEPDESPGLTWRQLDTRRWSGTWATKIRGTVTRDSEGWLAYLRLEDPPGPSPITTVADSRRWRRRRSPPTRCGRRGDPRRQIWARCPSPVGRLAAAVPVLAPEPKWRG